MMLNEGITECCPHPHRVNAPVDAWFPATGIRLRHLPASICLSCRAIYIPDLVADDSLVESVKDCIENKPSRLLVVKSKWQQTAVLQDEPIEAGYAPALLDIGIGNNSGLVVEGVSGYWNAQQGMAILSNEGIEMRRRLAQLDFTTECQLVPSLIYDTPRHPRSVQIELTTRCNLTCSYCTQSQLKIKEDITMDKLLSILDQVDFSEVYNVDFTGLGEPMLHHQLPGIIRAIKQRGNPSDIRVVTNGTVLTRERIKAVCDAGITSIAFSIDSVNPERFAKSRSGASLDKVLHNLETLVAYRREHDLDHLSIKIKAVLIDRPYEEAEGLLQLSARLQLEMPHFSCLDNRSNAKQQYTADWLQDDWSANESAAFTMWAEKRWAELVTPFNNPKHIATPVQQVEYINPLILPQQLCRWAIDAVFISAGGDMLPCCEQMIDVPRVYHGSLLNDHLTNLWSDKLFWGYRFPLSVGVTPKGCTGCTWAPGS